MGVKQPYLVFGTQAPVRFIGNGSTYLAGNKVVAVSPMHGRLADLVDGIHPQDLEQDPCPLTISLIKSCS